MKKYITIIVLVLSVSMPLSAHAMSFADFTFQLGLYRKQAAALALAAFDQTSTTGTVTTAPTVVAQPKPALPPEAKDILLKQLQYIKGTPALLNKKVLIGQNNDDVKILQGFLIAKGYLTADPNGNFGLQTKAALKKYQMDKHIQGADGTIAGPQTMAAIEADVSLVR